MTQRKKTQTESKTNKGTEITVAQIGLVTAVLVAIVSGVVTIISSYFSSQAAQAPILIPIRATQTAEAHLTASQDNSYATQVALQLTQLSVLQEMATSQAQSIVNFSPTATAFAQQIAEMQNALDRVPTPPVVATSQESKNLDIVFVFDKSTSLAQNLSYIEFQSFARTILAEVRINSDNRIGIITFSEMQKLYKS